MLRIKQFIKSNPKKYIGAIAFLLFIVFSKISGDKKNEQVISHMQDIVTDSLPVGAKIISQSEWGKTWLGIRGAGVKVKYEPVKGASIKSIINGYCQYFTGLGGWYEGQDLYEYSCNNIKMSSKQTPAVKTVGEKKYHIVMFCESRDQEVLLSIENESGNLKVDVNATYKSSGLSYCRVF
ncbi:hypothetical protein EOL70_15895 [Leucothrix sargassi]|nr:hypothetical protein EOL70_15895 [Leucothrix sargassi]